MSKILSRAFSLTFLTSLLAAGPAMAAKGMAYYSDGPSRGGSSKQEMMLDLSVHYVRDTSPDGATDTAAKFSLGRPRKADSHPRQ